IPDILVRFFDVGLEPGKVYRYCVQVRMRNPNFEYSPRDKVAFEALTKIKELYSPFVVTPEVRVPPEYHFYLVDAQRDPKDALIANGSDWGLPGGSGRTERLPVQVHRWVDTIPEERLNIGEWAIAERILVRKGDYIGRKSVYVQVPVWNEARDRFELHNSPRGKKGPQFLGVPVDFQGQWLLVDFANGHREKEEAAAEALVLSPEGKLIVRSARIDADKTEPIGKERQERYELWRKHGRERRDGPGNTAPGAAMPGIRSGKQ